MCTGIEIAMMIGAAASTTATLYNADTQKNNAEANAELTARAGRQEQDNALAQAEKIRRAGRAAAAQANAAMAASGVAIGEGTPLRINEAIYMDSESDAYSTLLTGTRRSRYSDEQAGLLMNEGKAAQTGGYISAGGSLLSQGADYGKWKTSQQKGAT